MFWPYILLLTGILISAGPEAEAETVSVSHDEMVLIPAGEFIAGSGADKDGKRGEDYGVSEEPGHKVSLKAFYIDKYEVTIGEYKEYLKTTEKKWLGDINFPQEFPPEIYFDPPEFDLYPANYISWFDANDFCQWKGKRLPTEFEWEKAARGTDGRRWTWGDSFDPSLTHVSENMKISWTARVGSHPEDRSPCGVYDMTGNLSEWTSSPFLPYPGNTINDGRYSRDIYVIKGGSFLQPGRLHGRPAARSFSRPDYSHRTYGFRCAKDAK